MNSTEAMTDVADSDPAVGLRAVATLRHLVEQLESLQVDRARDLGWSWSQIALALGVSKQAAHQKHGGSVSGQTKERSRNVRTTH